MFSLRFHSAADGFAVSDLRFFQKDVAPELRFQLLGKHLQLGFALPADDHFARLGILFHFKGAVLFGETVQPLENLVLVPLLRRVDRERQDGFREGNGGEFHLRSLVAERIAGVGRVQLVHRADIARRELVYGVLLFAAEHIELVDALSFPGHGIVDRHAAL